MPSRDGLEGARLAVRDVLGWEAVELLLASSPESGATGAAADPTDPYQFWYAYRRHFGKEDPRTQKELTATARAHGIDQADRSPENLNRMRATLAAG